MLDPDIITPSLSENYRHEFAPASLDPPLARIDGPEAFAARIKFIGAVMSSFPIRAKQTWPNPSLKQVVIWAESESMFHPHVRDNDDEEEWKYKGEYIYVITMDQNCEKIEHVLEFVDSKATQKLLGLVARASINIPGLF
ncbi:hypothetical protein MVEN_00378300 [Mycena venus]|uniref:Uncharacterized protein n=1 Tax=Mycena venus TaxID=2733690 RepID=A0A8H6YUK0_9AGAR|nr:hypothetical protein MVEN_00378300 [Mycena venus]